MSRFAKHAWALNPCAINAHVLHRPADPVQLVDGWLTPTDVALLRRGAQPPATSTFARVALAARRRKAQWTQM
jgi:hypothetical protein